MSAIREQLRLTSFSPTEPSTTPGAETKWDGDEDYEDWLMSLGPRAPLPGIPGFVGYHGFVQTEFSLQEISSIPLGLVVDWSMSYPVACGVLPDTPASLRPALFKSGNPGAALVLLRINGDNVTPGMPREKVQEMLKARDRPLVLLFEQARQQVALSVPGSGNRQDSATLLANPAALSSAHALKTLNLKTSLSLPKLPKTDIPTPPSSNGSSPTSGLRAAWNTGGLAARRGVPPPSDSWQGVPSYELGAQRSSSSLRSLQTTSKQRTSLGNGPSRSQSSTHISFFKQAAPEPDPCYQHLVDKACGPGAPAKWPLGHDAKHTCYLDDLRLAANLRDAYEVGFRGRKRAQATIDNLIYGVASPRKRTVEMVEKDAPNAVATFPQPWCDGCGAHLDEGEGPNFLWFCRKCKNRGNRFELCLECHAAEVLQAEGKHAGPAPHPHFLRCAHTSLVKRRDLRIAYPGFPHLRCVPCDMCGSYIGGLRGTDDRVIASQSQGSRKDGRGAHSQSNGQSSSQAGKRGSWRFPGSGEMYCCPTCPEEIGLRFELCEACAHSLLDLGMGILRLMGTIELT